MTESASILLIEDHPAVRMGLSMLFSRGGHHIAGEAANREELLSLLSQPNKGDATLALLDLSLGQESGFDLIDDLLEKNIPTIVYSMHEDATTIRRTLARGVRGYVCKREPSEELLAAVREIITNGNTYLSSIAAQSCQTSNAAPSVAPLSDREEQVIELLGRGSSKTEISLKLGISVRTVETHCIRTIEKFGLKGMQELRRFAIQRHASARPD